MSKTNNTQNNSNEQVEARKVCGIVMPIAEHPDYPATHWIDVQRILIEAIKETDFEATMVNDDDAVGLIHSRIVTNLYNNDLVVCDVSSKNPNVMFELGLRLAFDKPTIIIKDEKTGYTFDAGVIEHIPYPSSLRFAEIVKFKSELKRRIEATYRRSIESNNYSPFLKSFGTTIVPTKIEGHEISELGALLEKVDQIHNQVRLLNPTVSKNNNNLGKALGGSISSLIKNKFNVFIENNGPLTNGGDLYDFYREFQDQYKFKVSPNLIVSSLDGSPYLSAQVLEEFNMIT